MSDDPKAREKEVWSLGEYEPTSRQLEQASIELARSIGIEPGMEVLDVAAGDGNFAFAAARAGARVTASDLTPAMLERGKERATVEGLDVEWIEADAEDLPFDPDRFDVVTSVFGAMFAPQQDVVAAQLFRVAKAGGVVGMCSWTPQGLTARAVKARGGPPPSDDRPDPFQWGDEARVRELFGPHSSSIRTTVKQVTFEYASWDEWREAFLSHGVSITAQREMPPEDFEAMVENLQGFLAAEAKPAGGRVVYESDYLESIAVVA